MHETDGAIGDRVQWGRIELERRAFLAAVIGLAGVACAGTTDSGDVEQATVAEQVDFANPFTLGVASGDPTDTSVMLWTRLAPEPGNPDADARNGMPADDIAVGWEIATVDAETQTATVITSGVAVARSDHGHAVHVDAAGLDPDTWYNYRFFVGQHVSAAGRTRTVPSAGTAPALTFAFTSCQRREAGHYAAHRALAERGDDIDLFFWLGDYIYEEGPDPDAPLPSRRHDTGEVATLADYRNRYALYRSDPLLQAHHAVRPWIVTWDDHEVDDNYAATIPRDAEDAERFVARRTAAYQAWFEHMPVRLPAPTVGLDEYRIYRDIQWGDLAHFLVLDARQYRDDQPTDGEFIGVPGVLEDESLPLRAIGPGAEDPSRTMLGREQEDWLVEVAAASTATWKLLAQPVYMHGFSIVPGAEPPMTAIDTWDGYHGNRRELLTRLADSGVDNLVVLSGDFHAQSAADVRIDPFDLDTAVVAAEFMAGAVSSVFPIDVDTTLLAIMAALNPHIQHMGVANGYVVCDVTADGVRTGYWSVADVLDPNSPVTETAVQQVKAGTPGLA